MEEDGASVVRGFILLQAQPFFQRIAQNNWIVWTDTGKHFRNQTVVGYLLYVLANLEDENQRIHGLY
jgi:hypothetical protein